ncbi:DUF1890 domain-containing protein [Methanogenium sp. S4BF]|uniref:DUF1890 family protein n=1 Tax=Methanogenium sp. S4BF TaxID=1789226 RepID=UPI0024176AB1|nr:DUF1890 family protein [Methanogenium sp. S4BF]WFN35445.1 DUF1890 domain-containing protein [Methanogenium sp. S4BF]
MNEKKIIQEKPDTALILLGCPQIPIQTSAALYLSAILHKKEVKVTIGGTKAARALLEIADIDKIYTGGPEGIRNIDTVIDDLADETFDTDVSFVFVHNEAGVAYTATVQAISSGTVIAVVFGGETEVRMKELTEIGCMAISAQGSHNPLPLKKKIDEVVSWDA